ncbi:MAG TPA: hypothetical protein VGF69_20670 [Thermoanaerobaculia bacterium]|jgi:hypothetical protein
MYSTLPPHVKRAFRGMAALAYERELVAATRRLHEAFGDWNGSLETMRRASIELERKLAKAYKYNPNLDVAVAEAVLRGVIRDDEIPDEVTGYLWALLK